jgi:Protein of unknown function (DUF664)
VKQILHDKLRESRAALLSRPDGLGEYDLRRPLTPTGTNLLGLVKHLAGLEYGYLGESLGRPGPSTRVAHWPEARRDTTLGFLLVRMTAETAQHASHADIVRELIDGRGGPDHDPLDDGSWREYAARIAAAAETFRPDENGRVQGTGLTGGRSPRRGLTAWPR